jgi:phosphoglycolate phosphatase
MNTAAEVGRMRLVAGCRAVMLDLDGTLVDTLGDFVVALDSMLDELGLARIAAAQVAGMIGKGGEFLVRSALAHARPGVQPSDGDVAAALSRFWHHYGEVNGRHARVYAGVPEGLQLLRRRGLALACVTNKPTAEARSLLRACRLEDFFREVTGGDRFGALKPDPIPLTRTCEALGVAPAQTLMVGDSVNDVRAARAAAGPVVLVSYGYNHGQPVRSAHADGYVDSLADLLGEGPGPRKGG